LASYKALMLGFVVRSVLVGLIPLTLLVPTLAKIRRAGLLEYGKLANKYTKSFDCKWVHSQQTRRNHYWAAATFSRWPTSAIATPTFRQWTLR